MMQSYKSFRAAALTAVSVVMTAVLVSACGSTTATSGTAAAGGTVASSGTADQSDSAAPSGVPAPPAGGAGSSGRSGTANGPAGRGFRPAATGLIAQLISSGFYVQSTTAQTTVTYTGATKFSKTVTATLKSVKVGSCITAFEVRPPGGADAAGSGGAGRVAPQSRTATTGSGAVHRPTSITAGTVMITTATNGSCAPGAGFGGTRGARRAGSATGAGGTGAAPATPAPTETSGGNDRSPQPGGRRSFSGIGGFGGAISGRVTKVAGSVITVAGSAPGDAAPGGNTSGNGTVTGTATVTADTTYTSRMPATAKDATVGGCATVQGTADSTGAVKATTVELTPARNGSCTAVLGGFGGPGQRSRAGQQGGAAPTTGTTHG
jgi:hypothetical protein